MLGRSLLHYTITGKLGEGGMGVVYKARDTHLDRFAALKVLPSDRVADAERKRRFILEAKAASALNHPNIVTIYDIATDGDVTFIAMEYISGKTLAEAIPRQGLRPSEALNYAVQIADGLAKAHQAGIIHRDLKPGNIMIGDDGRVKILDFGLAKLTTPEETSSSDATRTAIDATDDGAIVGTASYMSPEQAEGRKLDQRTDIFSFGVVLYEMLAGRKPFSGETRLATLSAILKEAPTPLSGVPRELERIVDRCLRKDPDRRWQSMQDLRISLLDLREDSDSGKLPAPPPQTQKKRSLLVPIGIAAAVLLAAGAALILRPKPAEPAKELVAVPLTAYPGDERDPTFSPDGNQFAFSWGPEGGNTNMFVKLIGPGDPIRLTNNNTTERMAHWSPDGKWIALTREGSNVVVIPALGGPEKILSTEQTGSTCNWTPDSQWLTVIEGNPGRLYLTPLEGGEKKLVLGPLENKYGVAYAVISPDGKTLAVQFLMGDYRTLYAVSLTSGYRVQGEPRPIAPLDWTIISPAWTPDSNELVFIRTIGNANAGGNTAMYRVSLNGGAPQRMDYVGDNPWFLDVAPRGNRLALTRLQRDVNLHRVELEADGTMRKPSEAIASSSRREESASYSPDGSRIAFTSNRGGSQEIWVSSSDGKNLVQLTRSVNADGTARPQWSPDGGKILFVSRPKATTTLDVFVISSSGGTPQRLTDNPATDDGPSWSRDGRWIYFSSNRGGDRQLWKMPSNGGAATRVTQKGGLFSQESPDGRWLYFSKSRARGLWRIPVQGGDEETILSDLADPSSFHVTSRGVYYLATPGSFRSASLRLAPFSSGEPKTLGAIPRPVYIGLSISPDFKYVLYSQYDQSAADIMLVENFR